MDGPVKNARRLCTAVYTQDVQPLFARGKRVKAFIQNRRSNSAAGDLFQTDGECELLMQL
jgi:hypothetical protein